MLFFQKPACDWMIVGLGNPGSQYEKTRHNAGFLALDRLEKQLGMPAERLRHKALCAQAGFAGQKLLLVRPQTFMNASGLAVRQAADFYKIPPERIIVLFDDISLPVGRLRVRPSGSAGGHNGIKSIISALGSDAFPRVKIGVGAKPHPDYDLADWVLSVIPKSEQPAFQSALGHAADAALCLIEHGVEKAEARFNGMLPD